MKRKWTAIGMVAVLLASVLTGCGEKKEGEYFHYEIMGEKENRYICLKWSGIIIFGIIGPLLIIVLILGNVINLEKFL